MAKERAFFRSLVTENGEINPDLERATEKAEAYLAFDLVCSPPSLETFNAVTRWLHRRRQRRKRLLKRPALWPCETKATFLQLPVTVAGSSDGSDSPEGGRNNEFNREF